MIGCADTDTLKRELSRWKLAPELRTILQTNFISCVTWLKVNRNPGISLAKIHEVGMMATMR